MEKEEEREIWTIFGKFGQIRAKQQIMKMGKKGRKNKKRE